LSGVYEFCQECDGSGEDGCGNPCPWCEGVGSMVCERDIDDPDGDVVEMSVPEYRRLLAKRRRQIAARHLSRLEEEDRS
jgi:hypothetical protein